MKKLMFTLALVSLVFTSTQAQKQLGGEHNIEVNFAPFADQPFGVLSFGDTLIGGPSIKYRNFLDDDKALRFTLMLNNSSDTYNYRQAGEQNSTDPVSNALRLGTSTFSFGLAAGYEMHFDGTDNLSPYFGFEGFFMTNRRKDFMEIHSPNEVVNTTTDNDNPDALNKFVTWELGNAQSVNRFGLRLMFGADYYFNDAIYVGFEAGLGIGITKVGDHTISATDENAFHILFNNAASYDPEAPEGELTPSDIIGQELDSYTGYLPFDVTVFDLYTNSDMTNWEDDLSESENNYTYDVDQDYEGVSDASLLSGFELGIVFNPAIRIGFLFD